MNSYPGMNYGSETRYKRLGPAAEFDSVKFVLPSAGTSLNQDQSIHFRLVLGENEWGRLKNQPFYIKFKAKYLNPDYDPNATGDGSAEKKAKYHYVRPSSGKPFVYLPPSSGASCIFESAEVFLDGQDIGKASQLGIHGLVYQCWNRIYSNEAQRNKQGQWNVISGTKDASDLTADNRSDRMKKALMVLHNSSYNVGTSLLLTFGMDGQPFLAPPRNFALATLQGETKNDNLFLPPKSILDVTLHKRPDLSSAFEFPGITNASYYSSTADATNSIKDIQLEIEAIGIAYESKVMQKSNQIATDLSRGMLKLYFDVPKLSYQSLQSGQQVLNLSVLVPPGSKACMLGVMRGHQLWYSKADKKNVSGRPQFPASLKSIQASLAGHESLSFRRGFNDVGGSAANYSESCNYYFNELLDRGVIDYNLDEMFPRGGAHGSFIQSLFFDLRPFRIKDATTMDIELQFSANLSPAKCYLVTIFIQEYSLSKKRLEWLSELVL